jgi:translation initiation factor IF-3
LPIRGFRVNIIRSFYGDISIKKRLRLNHQITASTVRLLDAESKQIGVVPISEALNIARDQGYDLAEISPNAEPPVCKLLDWGKYQYEQEKQAAKNRKKQKNIEVKQVRMGLKIGQHDIEVKQRAAKKFLDAGNKVKLTVRFKGREMARPDLGEKLLESFFTELSDIAQVEQKPTMTGRDMSIVVAQTKQAASKSKESSELKDKENAKDQDQQNNS